MWFLNRNNTFSLPYSAHKQWKMVPRYYIHWSITVYTFFLHIYIYKAPPSPSFPHAYQYVYLMDIFKIIYFQLDAIDLVNMISFHIIVDLQALIWKSSLKCSIMSTQRYSHDQSLLALLCYDNRCYFFGIDSRLFCFVWSVLSRFWLQLFDPFNNRDRKRCHQTKQQKCSKHSK